jgi:hypothetical protein
MRRGVLKLIAVEREIWIATRAPGVCLDPFRSS